LALHFEGNLKLLCHELYHLALKDTKGFKSRTHSDKTIYLKDVKNMKHLIVSRWNIETASLANKDLHEKKWNKPLLIPLVSDIKLFREETRGNCPKMTYFFSNASIIFVLNPRIFKNGRNITLESLYMRTFHQKWPHINPLSNNNRTRNAPKSWEDYDVMEPFIGQDRPSVNPVAVCSNLAANIKQNITEAGASPERTRNKLKRQRNSPRTEMLKVLKDYKTEVEERENRRIALAEKHHSETKEMFASNENIRRQK
jgi:hypothetical protein